MAGSHGPGERGLRRVDPPPDGRRSLGNLGEEAAARYLSRSGLRILARGYRVRCGEIDLIAREGEEIVFVEVKTRLDATVGAPEGAGRSKRRGLQILEKLVYCLIPSTPRNKPA